MKLVWAGNFQLQPTGYARIARELMPRFQEAGHDVVQYAVSGLNNTMPFTINGIDTYGVSSMGGQLGINDFQVVNQMEDPDFWIVNFDAWAIGNALQQMDLRVILYPPIDHDPIAANWMESLNAAYDIVPYCQFGKRVIEAALEAEVSTPIYHGVDTDTYRPTEVTKGEFFGVDEDTFVIGLFKNNQGTRWKPVRQLRAVKLFVEEYDLWDDVLIYLHSSIQGEGAFQLDVMINRLELGDIVQMVNQGTYRWGVGDDQLVSAYNACDVVLNVTAGEGFGLPLLEAFATETPVIASAYSSMPELLGEPEGERKWRDTEEDFIDAPHGWLVPVWDVEPTLGKHSWRRTFHADHIKAAIEAAWSDPEAAAEKGEAAREWVEQFSWDAVADQWLDHLAELEAETFTEDEALGIDWEKVGDPGSERGGVGGFQR